MNKIIVRKVTSKSYNSKSVTNYFEKGISKKEIKEFLNENRDIKIGETEEKTIALIGEPNIIVRYKKELEYLNNVNSL